MEEILRIRQIILSGWFCVAKKRPWLYSLCQATDLKVKSKDYLSQPVQQVSPHSGY